MAGRCKPVRRRAEAEMKDEAGTQAMQRPGKPLTAARCRAFMRRRLLEEFEGIVNGFIESARAGSCQHVKLATELLEPRKRQKKEADSRGTLQRWVEEIERPE